MSELTKFLIGELLDTKKTVAIYGGGFKPPTKGHFTVAELALKELPDIDELKIFVGGGIRDGITQNESIQVWDIYKKYLSSKVSVEPSVAPVKSVLGYAKENPDTKVYWVLGAREGEESDLEDIKNRTKSLDKYPNLEVKVITSKGGISGTKTRAAIKAGNKEQFFYMIPDIKEKEQVWDIVSPVIKEGLVSDLKSKFNDFISAVKQENQETKEIIGLLVHAAQGKIELSNKDKEYIGNQLKDVLKLVGLVGIATLPGGFIAGALIKLFKAEHLVTPSAFVNEADPKKGTGKKPEGSGRRLYTDEDPKDTVRVKFKTKEDIVDTLNKKQFKAKSHARQSQVINLIHQRVRAAYGKAKDPEVKARLKRALDYIEKRKEASKKKTERLRKMKEASDPQAGTALPYGSGFAPVKELVTATQVICDNCGWEWDKKDGGKDLYICHKCGHDNTPKKEDPFGLNELARQFLKEALIETWKPEESFVSLSQYMIDNGMNIQPLPKIKVIKDDEQNASNLLGKTAYYNPVEKSITLYTMDRHPKDILRSFAHEMIHHEQNLDGRLGNINTTNTNEDGDLPEIEREAYEKGNMMLRNWEDKIKNPLKEYFLDIPKFNKPLTLTENLWKTLNEISLNPNNAAEIEGDLYRGMFKAGNKVYTYDIYRIENPYKDGKEFYNVEFHPKNNSISTPTGDTTKEDYIKILNTMYKIILDFAEDDEPDYIGIASMDSSSNKNYHKIYNNLTDNKFNNIPGYFRKDVNLEFNTPQGKGRFVVLKRKDV